MKPAHPKSLEYILGLTAFTAGTIDIVSYTQLGGVLASAMTGNLAFLGLYTAAGRFLAAFGSLIALFGYIAGAALGHALARGRSRDAALTRLLCGEALLLACAALLWLLVRHHPGSLGADILIVLLSVSMGGQSIAGKQINLSNIPTVVFTSTLTNIVIALTESVARRETFRLSTDTKRQLASFFSYLLGAFCAGLLVYLKSASLIVLPLAAAIAALAAHLGARRPAEG